MLRDNWSDVQFERNPLAREYVAEAIKLKEAKDKELSETSDLNKTTTPMYSDSTSKKS